MLLLEYRLHFAKCLDILFADEKRKAVEYAREHIVPRMKILDPQIRGFTDDTCDDNLTTSYKSDLQLLLKSLAVSGNGLFDAKKWFTNADRAALASFFDNVRAQQAGLPNESRLVASLRAGLTSLKTGAHVSMESELVSKQSEPEKGTRDDPLSSPALRALAVSLPLTKRARTRLKRNTLIIRKYRTDISSRRTRRFIGRKAEALVCIFHPFNPNCDHYDKASAMRAASFWAT